MAYDKQKTRSWKTVVLPLIVGILGGILGAALFSPFLRGPQGSIGEEGPQGLQGPQGIQGLQGIPGTDGTDGILQIIQNSNNTAVSDTSTYNDLQWLNMTKFDSSMKITINVQQDSKILAQFSSSHTVSATSSISVRIVLDNNYNSSRYQVMAPAPPSSGTYTIPGHIEFLTGLLSAGQHTIEVQFFKQGSPTVLDRTLTVIEIQSP